MVLILHRMFTQEEKIYVENILKLQSEEAKKKKKKH